MGDERLEDVIADRKFLDVSQVGPVCDEIYIGNKLILEGVPVQFYLLDDSYIALEEFLLGLGAEAALKPDGVRAEDAV